MLTILSVSMKLAHMIGAIATRLLYSALALSTLALFTLSISDAETDLNKSLVGTWKGAIDGFRAGTGDRTLMITAVSQKDGQWTADGLYGITGKRLLTAQIEVDVSREWPSLRFTTAAQPPSIVRLNLLGGRDLVGTLTRHAGAFTQWQYSIKLEKVE
jgi:hypothetical protein